MKYSVTLVLSTLNNRLDYLLRFCYKKGINQVRRHLLRLSLFHPKLVRQLKPVVNLCISLSNSFLSSAYNIMPYEA